LGNRLGNKAIGGRDDEQAMTRIAVLCQQFAALG
jgi:hypothetical protein